MNYEKRNETMTRERLLALLSDAEVASVSTAETASSLAPGEEYLDLGQLDLGVQRAGGPPTPMGRVLPKSAVHDATWKKLVAHLTPSWEKISHSISYVSNT